MKQELTTDRVSRYIEAPPANVYALVSDVTRTLNRPGVSGDFLV